MFATRADAVNNGRGVASVFDWPSA